MNNHLRGTICFAVGLVLGFMPLALIAVGVFIFNRMSEQAQPGTFLGGMGLLAWVVVGLVGILSLLGRRRHSRWLGAGILTAVIVTGYIIEQTLAQTNL